MSTMTIEERLEAVPDSVLLHGAETRTYTNLGVARVALFDFDYDGYTLIQVWDHDAAPDDQAWFFALLRWADNHVLRIWPANSMTVPDITKQSVDVIVDFLNAQNIQRRGEIQ